MGLAAAVAAMLLVTFAQTCQLSVERGERLRAERFGQAQPTTSAAPTPGPAAVLLLAADQRTAADGLRPTP
jgi:hypothetical protein